MKVLEFENVHGSYLAGEEVLSGVSFSIQEGQVVGLLGKNGAGKTTLIHIAMGMIRAQEGTVHLFGLDPQEDPVPIKRRVGFVSENQILPPAMRVEEVIRFHRELFPTWDLGLEQALRERFTFPGNSRVKSLSKGQARQLAVLCAVAHRPELLLLDEPAGGLDPAARREFLETAIQLLSESGTTILFSSHHMTDVERMADRIVLLHDKGVLIDSELDDLRENYALALLPASGKLNAAALAKASCCIRVREHRGALHAVFRGKADAVQATIERELHIASADCTHVPLEELFVELLGASS
jgi:ABC-2 type transport system ATP-binding protein